MDFLCKDINPPDNGICEEMQVMLIDYVPTSTHRNKCRGQIDEKKARGLI